MALKRKASWLLLEWAGTVAFGLLPDLEPVNAFLARMFYFFYNGRRFPNLRAPRHFNEKLIALKISEEGRDPLRTRVTDKELVKDYVAALCGPGHTPATLAVIRSAKEIDGFEFPLPSVVKPTHSSQEVMLLEGRQPSDEERRRLKYWIRKNYFTAGREPNYRGLEKKLIVEPIIGGVFGAVDDIKIWCFFGKPKIVQVDRGRYSGDHRRDFFDIEGRLLPVSLKYPAAGLPFPFPERLAEILAISQRLSAAFRFIRVDLYVADGKVLVGELTSFPSNCIHPFRPPEADLAIAPALDEPDFVIAPALFEAPGGPPRAAGEAAGACLPSGGAAPALACPRDA